MLTQPTHWRVNFLFVSRRDQPVNRGLILRLIGSDEVEQISRNIRVFVDVEVAAGIQRQEPNQVGD